MGYSTQHIHVLILAPGLRVSKGPFQFLASLTHHFWTPWQKWRLPVGRPAMTIIKPLKVETSLFD